MSSAWQLPYATLYFAPSNVKFCTSELFKFQGLQPYLHVCIQKIECTLSNVSQSPILESFIISHYCSFDKDHIHCL